MLVCSISMRPPRRAIVAGIEETATAADALGTGNIVFATLVDDPASVNDVVDAFTGEIMLEAASAADSISVGSIYSASINEPVIAASIEDALGDYGSDLADTLTAIDAPDASITSATTWNSADKLAVTLSGGDLIATTTATTNNGVRAVRGNSSGKYYFELTATTWTTTNNQFGLAQSGAAFTNTTVATTGKAIITGGGAVWVNGSSAGVGLGTVGSGTVVGIAVDLGANLIWFRLGAAGNWNASGTANPATGVGGVSISAIAGTLYPYFGGGAANSQVGTANFGASAFTGTVPSGFASGW